MKEVDHHLSTYPAQEPVGSRNHSNVRSENQTYLSSIPFLIQRLFRNGIPVIGTIHSTSVHGTKSMNRKRIVILGGGFVGVAVLNKLQERFQTDVSIDITMISKDNYLLFAS